MATKALTPAERRMEVVRRVDEQVRAKATRIVAAAMDAGLLNDDGSPVIPTPGLIQVPGQPPADWHPKKYRIAMDARRPQRDAPVYLAIARRQLESYRATDAAKAPAPTLAAQVNVFVSRETAQSYPVIDVSGDDAK